MKICHKIAVLAFATFAAQFASAINAGSDESAAVALAAPKATWQAKNITVTGAYGIDFDNNGNERVVYSTDFYVYYLSVTLTRGTTYTFNVKFNNDTDTQYMYGVDFYPDYTSMLDYHYDNDVTVDGVTYDYQFTVYGSDWEYVDEDTVTCYIAFSGDRGRTATVRYKTGVDIPEGIDENPGILTVGSGFSTATGTLTAEHGAAYVYKANLVAGRKYRFRTTSGTSTYPVDMVISPMPAAYKSIYTNDIYNVGYEIMPTESGSYEIVLSTLAPSVTLQYGQYPVRTPANHSPTALAAGTRLEFSPGHMNSANSDYFDTVIDESLFSFSATSGRRYRISTDSASVPLRMELYDANGNVLAKNTRVTAADRNVRVSFAPSSSATYYVGVCQDVDDDAAIETVRAGIMLTDVTDSTDGRDDVAAATPLSPVISGAYNYPAVVDPMGSGPYALSAEQWRNTFAIAARSGWTYYLFAEKTDGVDNGNGISGAVFTKSSSETAVESSGEITLANSAGLVFTASANATHYVRLRTKDAAGNLTEGLDYGSYKLHVAAVPPAGASGYSILQVNAKGPSSDDGATWRITSGTSGTEPSYPYGTTIPVIADGATFTVSYGSVANMSVVPQTTNVQYRAGGTDEVLAVYSDTYDPGDDTKSGAMALTFSASAKVLSGRTLWTEDGADWFSFSATAGMFYTASFAEFTGAPRIVFTDAAGVELASGAKSARFGAPKSGTYYIKVCHADDLSRADSTYKLSYKSVNAGYVSFSNSGVYSVAKGAEYAELTVNRSSSGGALRLDYGTVSGTATPGEDYAATSGTLSWADGDMSARTIRVPLIPDIRPENEGNEKFFMKIAAKPDGGLEENEYPAIISGNAVAEVTITDSGDAEAGTIAFTASGAGRTPLASGTVSVHPGDTAILWVTRDGGSNGVAEVSVAVDGEKWATLKWKSGESGAKMFGVSTYGDEEEYPITIQVGLSGVSGNAAFGRKTVQVVVDPDAPAVAYPGDNASLRLASGSFRGVLQDQSGIGDENGLAALAEVSMTAGSSGLSATVRVAGSTYNFEAASYDPLDLEDDGETRTVRFTLTHEVNGETYEDYLDAEIYNAPFSSLNRYFETWNYADLSLHLPSPDGVSAMQGNWNGYLYRDNRDVPDNAVAASVFKGRYTVALVATEQPFDDEPKGNGYLTMDVSENGSVSVAGTLSDGTRVAFNTLMTFEGSLSDAWTGGMWAKIPMYWQSATSLFGGVMNIEVSDYEGPSSGIPVVYSPHDEDSENILVWNSDAPALSQSGLPVRRCLVPVGGFYDASVNAKAWLYGKSVSAATDGYNVYFADNLDEVGFTVDQATGLVSGTVPVDGKDAVFSGVAIQNCANMKELALDGLFATGLLSFDDDTYPFSIYADETDVDNTEDYGLVSTISFNGNGNTSGNVPEPIKATVKSIEFIPPLNDNFLRTGYEFLGWTDGSSTWQPGDEIVVPAADTVLTAKWTISVAGVAEAFDCPKQVFAGDGAKGWFPQTAEFVTGVPGNVSSVRSGAIGDGQTTWLETQVEGPGQLSFWYKVSSEQNYDKLTVTIDGAKAGEYSGELAWRRFLTEISTPGTHTIRWTYTKDSSSSSGSDAAWIDLFSFGPTVTVTFDANGGTLSPTTKKYVIGEAFGTLPEPDYGDTATFDGWVDGENNPVTEESIVPDEDLTLYAVVKEKEWTVSFAANGGTGDAPEALSGVLGTVLELPGPGGLAKAGYEFAGWTDSSKTYKEGDSYTIATRANVTLSAVWSLSVAGVAEALGAPKAVSFTASGNAAWLPEEGVVDGKTAVRSGAIGHSSSTTLTATFSGSGNLSFFYKVSSESGSDKLAITVDGAKAGEYSGNVAWTEFARELGDGIHTIVWTYSKDSSSVSGSDRAWISELKFGPTVTVTFDANGGTLSPTTKKYVIGEAYHSLPTPDYGDAATFDGWVDGDDNPVTEKSIVPDEDITLYAKIKEKEWTVSFSANGGTGDAPNAMSGVVGAVLELPGPGGLAKAGYEFAGWTDSSKQYKEGDSYTIATRANVTLSAVWSLSVAGVAEALGASKSVSFTASGNAAWFPEEVAVDGHVAVRSGAIGHSQSTTLTATFSGSGNLSFFYKVSSESGSDKLTITVDGAKAGEYSGEVAWTEFARELGAGNHTIVWTYAKDSSTVKGSDRAWISELKFGPTVTVTFDANGGTLSPATKKYVIGEAYNSLPTPDYGDFASFDCWTNSTGAVVVESDIVPDVDHTLYAVVKEKEWTVSFAANGGTGDAPEAMSGVVGTVLVLPGPGGLAKAGYEFVGWTDSSKHYKEGDSYTIATRANVTLSAVWSLSVAGVAEALGAPKAVSFTASGNAAWFPEEAAVDGRTAVRSGAIGHSQSTTLTATFSGSGNLSFFYKVSSESGSDKLAITVDGAKVGEYSGNVAWTEFARELGDGNHTIVWTYSKDGSAVSGSDRAWISELKFGPTVTVTFDAKGGTIAKSEVKYVVGEPYGTLPVPGYGTLYSFMGWIDGNGEAVTGESIVPDTSHTLYAVTKASESVQALLDELGGDVSVSMEGASWFIQSNTVHTAGGAAIQSCAIGNSASTTFKVNFSGAGNVSFWHKVSSERNYDKLTITLDGAKVGEYSGESGWTEHSARVEDGIHVLSLTYAKDSSSSEGTDAAWLADFLWTPDKPPEYEFTVNWGEGVLGATYSIEDGVQGAAAENGVAIAVPEGKKITVAGLADTNNWYYITGGTNTFDSAGSTTVTAAKRDAENPGTAEEVGLSGAFADADETEVAKALTWAEANNKTVAEMSAMSFDAAGNPSGTDAKAYLLGCAPTEEAVNLATTEFKVESFSVDGNGTISIEPADASPYGNGHVEVRYSATPGGEYTTDKPKGGSCFIKLYLVK